MPNTTRVGLYARVSANAQNPEMQLAELRQYALRRNWQIVGEFVDVGVSGSKESRPKLDALMLAAKRRQVDVIACWKLDRFGRSLRHLVNALAELEAVGCAFVSLRDNLDLSTPAGRMLFQVIGAMAEFERQLIRERVRAGIANAKAKGKTLGRPRRILNDPEYEGAKSAIAVQIAASRQTLKELTPQVPRVSERALAETRIPIL